MVVVIKIASKKYQQNVNMQWYLKTFDQLSVYEFHNILKLRIGIFVVEQNCPYPELDDKDQIAYHLFASPSNDSNEIVAYTRIFKPGDYYKEAAFGRVVVHQNFRKQNLGKQLINKTIEETYKLCGRTPIKIGGQTYLKKFYESFDFKQEGTGYIEDGIPHIYMIKK